MKITYNAPFVLTFCIISCIVRLMGDTFTQNFFAVGSTIEWLNPIFYFTLFSHALGHANWEHLIGNFALILILGPILEEKYGSKKLLRMSVITAFVTGVLNVMFLDTGLHGASGIVFMMIVLASITNLQDGHIPLTFILVMLLYVGKEVVEIGSLDNVSRFGHIIGGVCGSLFGFDYRNRKN